MLTRRVSDFLHSSFYNNSCVCALFLNVRKAFDPVNHTILLKKLYCVGFRGSFFALLHNYLWSRSQLVSLGNVQSSKVPLLSGLECRRVPILSPLLFNIYVNNLPAVVTSNMLQYADGTLLFTSHTDIEPAMRMLQTVAFAVMDWFKENRITVNSLKTKFSQPLEKAHCLPELIFAWL